MLEAGYMYACWDSSKTLFYSTATNLLFLNQAISIEQIPKHSFHLKKTPSSRVSQTRPAACFQISLMRGLLSNLTFRRVTASRVLAGGITQRLT